MVTPLLAHGAQVSPSSHSDVPHVGPVGDFKAHHHHCLPEVPFAIWRWAWISHEGITRWKADFPARSSCLHLKCFLVVEKKKKNTVKLKQWGLEAKHFGFLSKQHPEVRTRFIYRKNLERIKNLEPTEYFLTDSGPDGGMEKQKKAILAPQINQKIKIKSAPLPSFPSFYIQKKKNQFNPVQIHQVPLKGNPGSRFLFTGRATDQTWLV